MAFPRGIARFVLCRPRLIAPLGPLTLLFFLARGLPGSVFGAVPAPWDPLNHKAGRIFSADSLTRDQRAIRVDVDTQRQYPERLKFGAPWQAPRNCGPNALYVLLRICGIDATLDDVMRRVPVNDEGANLADLADAAEQLGLRNRVVNVSERELYSLSPPFILHENVNGRGQAAGHFLVVCRFDSDGNAGIIDGISDVYQIATPDRLTRSFSGYALVPEDRLSGLPTVFFYRALYVLGGVIAALGFRLIWLSARGRSRRE